MTCGLPFTLRGCTLLSESPPVRRSPAQIPPGPECALAYSTTTGCAECPGPTESDRPGLWRGEFARSVLACLHGRATPGGESSGPPLHLAPRPEPPPRQERTHPPEYCGQSQIHARYYADKAPLRNPPRQSCAWSGPASRGICNPPQTHLPPYIAYAHGPAPHGCTESARRAPFRPSCRQ